VSALTLDLGTSATKAALWNDDRLVALSRASIPTSHPRPGWVEQDPNAWWESAVNACAELATRCDLSSVRVVGFSAARETFALFDTSLRPLGPGVLWSDARGASNVLQFGDPDEFRNRTGVVLNAACCAAKVAWAAAFEADRFKDARWILAPRDWVAARLTGTVCTDVTLASRTGFYALEGGPPIVDSTIASRLPPVRRSADVVGYTSELGLPPNTPVVIGAGDRGCEVIGAGATPMMPMVSWGTTTNLSAPTSGTIENLPHAAAVSRHPTTGYVIEAGLSASGAALDWLSIVTGRPVDALWAEAAGTTPGANGVISAPWLHGARAPHWQPDAHAAFLGLTGACGPGDLGRAVIEAVALDVARCCELVADTSVRLTLAGGGASNALWREILAAATNRKVVRRAVDDAASVGARLLIAEALGEAAELQTINPVVEELEPEPQLVERYRELRERSDRALETLLSLERIALTD
jgi:xylulokinase